MCGVGTRAGGEEPAESDAPKAPPPVANPNGLKPLGPPPSWSTHPAFQLYTEIDLPILAVTGVISSARLARGQPAYCAPLCDPGPVNAFDRFSAGFWNPGWATASDVTLYSMLGATVLGLMLDEGFWDGVNDLAVITESGLSALAMASLGELTGGRPRPFLYGTQAPLSARLGADAALSFVSSHAALSFAVATSLFMAERKLRPESRIPLLILSVGLATASFIATARVVSGYHFTTDVIGGALVGSAMGVLVPSLHSTHVRVLPIVSDTQRGIGFAREF